MLSYRKDIVRFTWAVSGIMVLAIFLVGLFFYVDYATTGKDVLVQEGFCGVQDSPETIVGKELFNSNCAACHKIDGIAIGPGLRDTSKEKLTMWVQLQPMLMDEGEFGRDYHYNTFSSTLTTTEIEALYHYLNRLKVGE